MFDEFQGKLKWKDEVINSLRGKVSKLDDDMKIVENELDR